VMVVTQARQQGAVNKQKIFRIHALLQEVAPHLLHLCQKCTDSKLKSFSFSAFCVKVI